MELVIIRESVDHHCVSADCHHYGVHSACEMACVRSAVRLALLKAWHSVWIGAGGGGGGGHLVLCSMKKDTMSDG